jgi:PPOX class probable F420-dependent enzyme
MTVLAPEVLEFLRGPHLGALATVRPDGRPHVTQVWYEFDGRDFVMGAPRGARKLANLERRPVAALSIGEPTLPYRQVIVEGPVRIGAPLDNVWRERVAVRYLGEAAGRAYARDTWEIDMIALYLRPVKWFTEGFETS